MTSWMEERDRLVAQTMAFVQQVAAAHPTPVTVPPREAPSEQIIVADFATQPDGPAVLLPEPEVSAVAAQPVEPSTTLPPPFATPVSERDDIMQRVAAFRARQGRIIEEREAYYEAVKAKIKTVLGNESGDGRL